MPKTTLTTIKKKRVEQTVQDSSRKSKKPRKETTKESSKDLEQKENLLGSEGSKGNAATNKTPRKYNKHTSSRSMTTDEASELLKRKLSQDGNPEVELRPIPKGRAQFMIGQTKGMNGKLNTLYDSGCYALLLKEGVQRELGTSVLKTKGPFYVNGVGNTTVKVNDEWLTSIPLIDGSRQIVEGWTVDEVTGTLPEIDLTQAVEELKANDKNNIKLQGMYVKLITGGHIDILLGTMYNAIFPIPVHSLPSGLTIYELQISSHDGIVNSVIGGPHESFERMAQQEGGLYNLVFSNIVQSLENYRDFGAPSLPKSLVISKKEEDFCKDHKEWEIGEEYEDIFEELYNDLSDEPKVDKSNSYNEKNESSIEDPSPSKNSQEPATYLESHLTCNVCGEDSANDNETIEIRTIHTTTGSEDQNTTAMRKLQQSMSEGMQIEYRCPRCRSCNDCRRSFETERVSLREEAEDLMIHESINIDWEKHEIVCRT